MDLGQDQINSTNLGKHSRVHEAGSIAFTPRPIGRFTADARLRLDRYQKWSEQESCNIALGYQIIEDRLRIKTSFARSFRVPSFTELYYSDSANRGNPDLKVEKSDNAVLGLEFSSAVKPYLDFSYTYMDADKNTGGFLSKYALDILEYQFILNIAPRIFGLDFSWQLSYNQRYYGETYFVGNFSISKKITGKAFSIEPYIKIDNFSNTQYTEIAGVLQPRRWIKSGVRLEW